MAQSQIVYIALLRGINVGGHVKIGMADLRELVGELGFAQARSILQSGNLVFVAKRYAIADLERFLETATETRFGLRIDYFVRTAADWQTLVRQNPFAEEAERDPAHLLAVLLKKAASQGKIETLKSSISGPERFAARSTCAYVTYPAGIGNSRVSTVWLERMLETRGTGRNWNTVLKLASLAESLDV